MRRDAFQDRHPLLYHLRSHFRDLRAAALSIVLLFWSASLIWLGGRALLKMVHG